MSSNSFKPLTLQTDAATSLEAAKAWLAEHADHGVVCPCCQQIAKIYRRTITSSMAAALIYVHNYFRQKNASEWLHVPSYLSRVYGGVGVRGGDWAKLRYFSLLIPKDDEIREDGSRRVGFWQITETGVKFAINEASVPKWVAVYDGEVIESATERITIREALKEKFNYEELMGFKVGAVPS